MLVESFLPGADLTFGIIGDADGHRLMITYYLVADRPPATTPLDRRSRLLPWGAGKSMVVVDEPALRRQVEALAPTICAAIGVRDVTRVDGRVDDHGTLRIFDVNGMPALVFPEGVIVAQALACDPERPADAVFDGLVAGILDAAERRFAASR
jgi:D-alanine-D-alanine ligase-like ATP-grasp enzyme